MQSGNYFIQFRPNFFSEDPRCNLVTYRATRRQSLSEIGFGRIDTYTKLDKLGEVRHRLAAFAPSLAGKQSKLYKNIFKSKIENFEILEFNLFYNLHNKCFTSQKYW